MTPARAKHMTALCPIHREHGCLSYHYYCYRPSIVNKEGLEKTEVVTDDGEYVLVQGRYSKIIHA